MQAGPEGSVTLGKAAPVSRGQFLERDMTEPSATNTPSSCRSECLSLKGGLWVLHTPPHPPHWVSRSHYLHFPPQKTMFIKQWVEHLSKTKGRRRNIHCEKTWENHHFEAFLVNDAKRKSENHSSVVMEAVKQRKRLNEWLQLKIWDFVFKFSLFSHPAGSLILCQK